MRNYVKYASNFSYYFLKAITKKKKKKVTLRIETPSKTQTQYGSLPTDVISKAMCCSGILFDFFETSQWILRDVLILSNIRIIAFPVFLRGSLICPSYASSSFLKQYQFVGASTPLPCNPESQVCCVPPKISLIRE